MRCKISLLGFDSPKVSLPVPVSSIKIFDYSLSICSCAYRSLLFVFSLCHFPAHFFSGGYVAAFRLHLVDFFVFAGMLIGMFGSMVRDSGLLMVLSQSSISRF